MKSIIIKIFIFLVSVILVFPVFFAAQGCKSVDTETTETASAEEKAGQEPETGENGEEQDINNIDSTANGDKEATGVSPQEAADSGRQKPGTSDIVTETMDISELRLLFTKALEYFDKDSYLIAEFYLNKIKDDYKLLQDHIYYYMAKILLSQEKYYQAEEYYLKIIKNYPDKLLYILAIVSRPYQLILLVINFQWVYCFA